MIVVLGSNGLLGSTICKQHSTKVIGLGRHDFNACNPGSLVEQLEKLNPTTVINCVGITPRHPNQAAIWRVNTNFPIWLSIRCDLRGWRLIHVSSDCVFSPTQSRPYENTVPGALDDYGWSKRLGEINHSDRHLTVRTSFVGLPDPSRRGLLAWLEDHRGQEIQGYTNATWNGVTVDGLAYILTELAEMSSIVGVRHIISTETLSKYDMLCQANEVFRFGCQVVPHTLHTSIHRELCTKFSDVNDLFEYYLDLPFRDKLRIMKERLYD